MMPPLDNLAVWLNANSLNFKDGEKVTHFGDFVGVSEFNLPARLDLGGVGRNMTMEGHFALPVDVFLLFNTYSTAIPTATPLEISLFRGTALESIALATPGKVLKMYAGDLCVEMPFIVDDYVVGHFIWGKHQMKMEVNGKGPGWVKYKKPPVHPGGFVIGDDDSPIEFEYRIKELLVYTALTDAKLVHEYLLRERQPFSNRS